MGNCFFGVAACAVALDRSFSLGGAFVATARCPSVDERGKLAQTKLRLPFGVGFGRRGFDHFGPLGGLGGPVASFSLWFSQCFEEVF